MNNFIKKQQKELKREILSLASYIDNLLECPPEEKATLNRYISRMSELMIGVEEEE